jgi:lipid II:glycine glycyltransferase (peptidoglycan interpeptide bridge formation enzyme)
VDSLWQSSRRNLKIALTNELTFIQCSKIEEMERVYEIIRKNREARGFPLRMTFEEIYKTSKIIPANFFIVADKNSNEVASAIAFTVAARIVQIIYWGDLPGFTHLKSMNFLSYKIFEFYKEKEFKFVDIGISTENSNPNYGLCEFKESIGCASSPKYTFSKLT